MTADPLAWLHATLDAAEAAAHEAAALCGCHPEAPAWSFGDESTDGRILVVDDPHPSMRRKLNRRWNGSYDGLFAAEHIAAHDPAATLRRIAADRKQLDLHAAVRGRFSQHGCPALCDGTHEEPPVCRSCRSYADDPIEAPCPTVEILAEGWGWTGEQP
jgi:hypothetical protein